MAAEEHQQQQQQQPAVAGGGSRFAVTCGLLRQYMKEQGGRLAPAVAMGLVPPGADAAAAEEEERKPVLELFPQQAGTLKDDQQRCVSSEGLF
jgi:jasmonate ZIM domain-containing protein